MVDLLHDRTEPEPHSSAKKKKTKKKTPTPELDQNQQIPCGREACLGSNRWPLTPDVNRDFSQNRTCWPTRVLMFPLNTQSSWSGIINVLLFCLEPIEVLVLMYLGFPDCGSKGRKLVLSEPETGPTWTPESSALSWRNTAVLQAAPDPPGDLCWWKPVTAAPRSTRQNNFWVQHSSPVNVTH